METFSLPLFLVSAGGFKSYYVVWKPGKVYVVEFDGSAFKSYYVVWKRFFRAAAFLLASAFKSYYVVWKLFCGFFIFPPWLV